MPTPEIVERVRKLHSELGEIQPDPTRAPAVVELREHADAVIREPDHAPHYKSLGDKLLVHYVGFEQDHPTLAKAMESLANALSSVT